MATLNGKYSKVEAMKRPRNPILLLLLILLISMSQAAQSPLELKPDAKPMTLEVALLQLRTYQDGQSRLAIKFLEKHIYKSTATVRQRDDIRRNLLDVLSAQETPLAAKRQICQWLPLLGQDGAIPVLESMLDHTSTFSMALGAMERLPGSGISAVLIAALSHSKGASRIAIINAMGYRADANTVDALIAQLHVSDPRIMQAAAVSLSDIGTPKAAEALLQARQLPEDIRDDALLRAAQQLVKRDQLEIAEMIYRDLWQRKSVGGLIGLVNLKTSDALGILMEAVRSEDPLLSKTAIHLTSTISDAAMTEELIKQLLQASGNRELALTQALGERGDQTALPALHAKLSSDNEEVVLAAVIALERMGGSSSIQPLAQAAASQSAAAQKAAYECLLCIDDTGVNGTIMQLADSSAPAVRVQLIGAAAARKIPNLDSYSWKLIRQQYTPSTVKLSAIEALGSVGQQDDCSELLKLWVQLDDLALREATENAIVEIERRSANDSSSKKITKLLREPLPTDKKASLLIVLGKLRHPDSLPIIRATLSDDNPEIQTAALKAMLNWPHGETLEDLLAVIKQPQIAVHVVLAQRELLRRCENKKIAAETRLRMATALCNSTADASIKDRAGQLQQILHIQFPGYRIQCLRKSVPAEYHLALYLNCGVDAATNTQDGMELRLIDGHSFHWNGSETHAHAALGYVVYNATEIVFEVNGLNYKRRYMLGVSWWDYDNGGRVQSIKVDDAVLLPATQLPSYIEKQQPPQELTIQLLSEIIRDGKCRIGIKNESGVNAVVSEIWLIESVK
jgi:HEAT repeat protein